ncbi:MAG: hypothetical protein QOF76_5518 [Solirubrobacteraceae bacterium]|nr:hypothetical protein [Solirubrobacteraceae bacterium]
MTGLFETWLERRRYKKMFARMAGPKLMRCFAEVVNDPFFVEIGANDGSSFDQIGPYARERGWRGIMVEPVPYVFTQLQAAYADSPGVRCENVAIADRAGTMPFFHFAEASLDERGHLPDFYDAVGSFSRAHVAEHAPELADRIVETEVPTVTFDGLLEGEDRLDLLVIDTEGYDWEILRRIDFRAWRPRLVLYEHYHLQPRDRAAARQRLTQRGYETLEEGLDTWCLRPDPEDALTELFRASPPALPGMSRFDG